MVHLLLPMTFEPPPRFVAFVERHLAALRRDAARVVGRVNDAEELYPLVLIDVAAHWSTLELVRRHLHDDRSAETYLTRAFTRHATRWRRDQVWAVENEVWRSERAPMLEIEVWQPPEPLGEPFPPAEPESRQGGAGVMVATSGPGHPTVATSTAMRLAPYLVPAGVRQAGPLAEATIAWLRARAARQQSWLMVWLTIAVIFAMFLAYFAQQHQ